MKRRPVQRAVVNRFAAGFCCGILIFASQAVCQVKADSAATGRHSPSAVMLRSALLPGWGQWVNGCRFKAVIAAGGTAALAATAVWNNQKRQAASTGDERTFYEDGRSQAIWYLAALYGLNLMDAYVDAHLKHFDVSGDLSVQPGQAGEFVCSVRIIWAM
ncbi:hypothetical protein JW906_02590 [bacterium]|nr:hypothetical protein [bacterium]